MHVPRLEVEVVAGHSERPEATSLVLGPEVCPAAARVPPKAEERLTTSSPPPGVSESRGRPDHPTRFSWDHSPGRPSRFPQVPTQHRVPVERLGEEAEERERERQATMELQYRLKKLEIEAETALKMRRLELEAEGRLPLNPSRVVAAVEPAHSPVQPVDEAAVLADEFALTHRTTFGTANNRSFVSEPIRRSANTPPVHKEQRECFYCHKPGHVISNCLALKRKSNYSATDSFAQSQD
uniref:CCHC-type domain-containing protein n=1 Tax=Knipowitschia caucasica TaxID=637954 RepID=A0AAV2KT16_KNICA